MSGSSKNSKAHKRINRYPMTVGQVKDYLRAHKGPFPLELTTGGLAEDLSVYTGTMSTVLTYIALEQPEFGLTRLTPGTYTYVPSPTDIKRAKSEPVADPVMGGRKSPDGSISIRVMQYATGFAGTSAIVSIDDVHKAVGGNRGSIPGALARVAARLPELGITRLFTGVYRIEPKPGLTAPGSVPAPEPAPVPEPPRPQPPEHHAPVSLPPAPGLPGISATPEAALRGSSGPSLWEPVEVISATQVLQRADDGTYWMARRLS